MPVITSAQCGFPRFYGHRDARLLWKDDQGAEPIIAGSLDDYRVGIPLGRIALPSDIADAVVFSYPIVPGT